MTSSIAVPHLTSLEPWLHGQVHTSQGSPQGVWINNMRRKCSAVGCVLGDKLNNVTDRDNKRRLATYYCNLCGALREVQWRAHPSLAHSSWTSSLLHRGSAPPWVFPGLGFRKQSLWWELLYINIIIDEEIFSTLILRVSVSLTTQCLFIIRNMLILFVAGLGYL